MIEPDLIQLFTTPLASATIEYMITGRVACIAYGEPRMTHDVAIVAALARSEDEAALERAFPASDFYLPPVDVIRAEAARALRGHFNVIHHDSGFKADVYLVGKDPLHLWAFPRRRKIALGDRSLVVAPPEYVIVRKLEYFREGGSTKHVDDIAGVLRVSPDEIDRAELSRLVRERGLDDAWRAARERAAT